MVRVIEEIGAKYGLKLNRAKCEILSTRNNCTVTFANGEKIKQQKQATYLGAKLNYKSNVGAEVNQ